MKNYRFETFDFFRGIAIFLVFLNHIPYNEYLINETTPFVFKKMFLFGTYGVQLFYIVSAATLLLSIAKRAEASYIYFYIRRIFRIVPVFYFGIILHILYFGFFKQYNYDLLNIKNIFLNLFFLNNIIPPSNDIILGGSTISTEMNFYLILPILFFIFNNYWKSLIFSIFYLIFIFFINDYSEVFLNDRFFGDAKFYRTIFVQLYIFSLGFCFFYTFKEILIGKVKINNYKSIKILYKVIPHIFLALIIVFLDKQNPEFFYFKNMLLVSTLLYISISIFFLFQHYFIKNILFVFFKKIGEVSFSMYILHWITIDLSWKLLQYLDYFNYFIVFFILFSFIITFIASHYLFKLEKFFISKGKIFIKNL